MNLLDAWKLTMPQKELDEIWMILVEIQNYKTLEMHPPCYSSLWPTATMALQEDVICLVILFITIFHPLYWFTKTPSYKLAHWCWYSSFVLHLIDSFGIQLKLSLLFSTPLHYK